MFSQFRQSLSADQAGLLFGAGGFGARLMRNSAFQNNTADGAECVLLADKFRFRVSRGRSDHILAKLADAVFRAGGG